MRLRGLPPLAGFVVKMVVVFCVGDKLVLFIALAGSIRAIFYYLKTVIISVLKDYNFCVLDDEDFVWIFIPLTLGLYVFVYLLGCLFL
jgi:NADH:ubiquinone oxidoreductase subunit 2 (subunit N)